MAYRFADFVFDPDSGLSQSGRPIDLEPLAFELLRYLLENRSRVISRDELNQRLWDGRIVSDAALSTQVRGVRRALGDGRKQQRFIRTYPRRGFSFVAEVEAVESPLRQTTDSAATICRQRSSQGRSRAVGGVRRLATPWTAFIALSIVLIAANGFWNKYEAVTTNDNASSRALSIVVLPFDNLSGDHAKDYLADAFTEDLITDLSRIRDAFVISRSTTFTYRGAQVDAASVAHELGVRYVLEGSLRVSGNNVRINAQLIDGESNSHIWSRRYDRPLSDLFDLHDNVTGQIALVLRAELRVAANARQGPEVTSGAWDLALRGNVILYNHETIADYQQAYDLLTRAVSIDPTISSAWAGLSFIHYAASVATIPDVSRPNSAELSLEAAQKAVEADPNNAEPYWLVGVGYARTGQPEKGMAACETAITINPNMDCGYVCAGLVHMARDEPELAVPRFHVALDLNPLFRPFVKEKYLGLAYLQSGDYDQAIAALNRALAMAPKDTFSNLTLAAAMALDGRIPEAREALRRASEDSGALPPISSLREGVEWLGPRTKRMFDALSSLGQPEE